MAATRRQCHPGPSFVNDWPEPGGVEEKRLCLVLAKRSLVRRIRHQIEIVACADKFKALIYS